MTQASTSEVDPGLQLKINKFSNLNYLRKDLVAEVDYLKGRMTTCKDSSDELEMIFDEECVKLQIGECFFKTTVEEVQETVQKVKDATQEVLDKKSAALSEVNSEMTTLKTELYNALGSSINLEDK